MPAMERQDNEPRSSPHREGGGDSGPTADRQRRPRRSHEREPDGEGVVLAQQLRSLVALGDECPQGLERGLGASFGGL